MTRRRRLGALRAVVERVPLVGPWAIQTARTVRGAPPGRGSVATAPTGAGAAPALDPPGRFIVSPRPAPVPEVWPIPPSIEDPMEVLAGHLPEDEPAGPPFDVELFDALNAEYVSRPLVPAPQQYDDASLLERAKARLSSVHRVIDLTKGPVLEFGCGGGYELWQLSHTFGVEGFGVDIQERRSWATLADERTRFVRADLALDQPFPPETFARVVSFAVFEHVAHPVAALTEIHRVMKPGGLAWIKGNLYRGPKASHRYRWVHFPFPHLLFTDEVFRESCRRNGLPEEAAVWVNRLSWADYERAIRRIGFEIRMLRFQVTPLDEEFYARFEDVLGRYPKTDLTRDFFEVVLEKVALGTPRP